MNGTAAPAAGPAGIAAQVEGAAFTPLVKGLSTVLIAGLLLYGTRNAGAFFADGRSSSVLLFLALLAGFVLWCFWWMLISRTTVTATHLRQSWWSDKHVAIAEITQTKLILIPGLTWLIAPRLVVRTRSSGSVVFHAAEPTIIAAFARVSLGLPSLGGEAAR